MPPNRKRKREEEVPLKPEPIFVKPLALTPQDIQLRKRLKREIKDYVEKWPKIQPGGFSENRKFYTVGGSEISVLFNGRVHDTSREDLIRRKTSTGYLNEEEKSEECLWGLFFEPFTRRYTEAVCKTTVTGYGICIRDGLATYLPDGLGVVTCEKEDGSHQSDIALLEIKCPIRRKPMEGIIPEEYKMQIWDGLGITEGLTSYGLYVDAAIRICKRGDLGSTPGYNRAYHYKSVRVKYGNPIAWGLIKIYSREKPKSRRKIDFGERRREKINEMFGDVLSGKLIANLDYLEFADGRPRISDKDKINKSVYLVGALGFKIMKVVMIKVEPELGFKEQADLKRKEFNEASKRAKLNV